MSRLDAATLYALWHSRPVNNDTLTVFLQELLSKAEVLSEEHNVIRTMLDDNVPGVVIREDRTAWLDQLIEHKRG